MTVVVACLLVGAETMQALRLGVDIVACLMLFGLLVALSWGEEDQ